MLCLHYKYALHLLVSNLQHVNRDVKAFGSFKINHNIIVLMCLLF